MRCAIYSRNTAIRISSVPQLRSKNRLSKSNYETKLWVLQNIFSALTFFGFSRYGHILGRTLCSQCSGPMRRPGRQVHGSTGLAPRHHVWCPYDFLGLVKTSRTSLVRNNERYLAFYSAVPQAFLEVSDLQPQFGSVYL